MVSIHRDPQSFLSDTSYTIHELSVYFLTANTWGANNSNFAYKKDKVDIIYRQTEAQNIIFKLCIALKGHKGHNSKAVGKEGTAVRWQPLLSPAAMCGHHWSLSSSTPDNVYMLIN